MTAASGTKASGATESKAPANNPYRTITASTSASMTASPTEGIRILQARTIEDEQVVRAVEAVEQASSEQEREKAIEALKKVLAPAEKAVRQGPPWPGCEP